MADKLIDKAVELLRSTQDTPYKIAKATGLSQTIIGKWKKGEGKFSDIYNRFRVIWESRVEQMPDIYSNILVYPIWKTNLSAKEAKTSRQRKLN